MLLFHRRGWSYIQVRECRAIQVGDSDLLIGWSHAVARGRYPHWLTTRQQCQYTVGKMWIPTIAASWIHHMCHCKQSVNLYQKVLSVNLLTCISTVECTMESILPVWWQASCTRKCYYWYWWLHLHLAWPLTVVMKAVLTIIFVDILQSIVYRIKEFPRWTQALSATFQILQISYYMTSRCRRSKMIHFIVWINWNVCPSSDVGFVFCPVGCWIHFITWIG